MTDDFKYINDTYKVDYKKGQRVIYTGDKSGPEQGIITGTNGPHLMVKLDRDKVSWPFHPTWNMHTGYPPAEKK